MSQTAFYLKEKPSKLFLKAAVTGGISMLASSLYFVFESIFVGKFLGTTAFAALGLAIPIVIMNFALAELVGVGSSVAISIFLGQKKYDKANNYFSCAVLLTVFTGIISGTLIFFAAPFLLRLMGAEGELLNMAIKYLRVYALFSPIAPLQFSLDNYLRICGKTKTSMGLNIFFSVLTVGLELLLIRTTSLGLVGAALGTSIAMVTCVSLVLILFIPGKLQLKFVKPRFSKGFLRQVARNGIAPFLTNISGRIFSVIMNTMFLKFGGEAAVAIYGVVMTLSAMIEQLVYGVADSLQPTIGCNYGAEQFDRVKTVEKYVLATAAVISVTGGIILFSIPSIVATPFLEDLSLLDLAVFAVRISSFSCLIKWFNTAAQCFFMALEKPMQAMTISIASACVFPLLLILALLPMGLTGLWCNYPLTAFLTAVLALCIILKYKKRLFTPKKQETLNATNKGKA